MKFDPCAVCVVAAERAVRPGEAEGGDRHPARSQGKVSWGFRWTCSIGFYILSDSKLIAVSHLKNSKLFYVCK